MTEPAEFISLARPVQTIQDAVGEKWTLVLPAVTVGNVGQLAVDLLLGTVATKHLGRLRANELLPVAAPSPDVPKHLSPILTPLELYAIDGPGSVVIAQQRSPIARGLAAHFAESVISWARGAGCVEVVVLASANAAGRRDPQLRAGSGPPSGRIRVAATSAANVEGKSAQSAVTRHAWAPMEGLGGGPANGGVLGWAPEAEAEVEEDRVQGFGRVPAFLPTTRRGAFVRCILENCESQDFPLTSLIMFVHEGDNTLDACVMASAATVLLGLSLENEIEKSDDVPAPEGDFIDPIMPLLVRWKIPEMWHQVSAPPPGLY